MLINNIQIINNEQQSSQIRIDGSKIIEVNPLNSRTDDNYEGLLFNFSSAIAFPGLVNSHDHLDFNLFPNLGNRIYNDYIEWGNDINVKYIRKIALVNKVPKELSYRWGLYKNLICGVTTVIHHGKILTANFNNLPDVYSNYNYLHSLRIENKWKFKFLFKLNRLPFLIHIGEGTNKESINEIDDLIKWNFFKKDLIGIHAIAMNEEQSKQFKAIIWCPDSNSFLYNKTANIPLLKKYTNILFGTDSTLSADWNLWNHLRLARDINYLNEEELFLSISETASKVWGLKSKGKIEINKSADIVICKKKYKKKWESFYSINPEDILLILKNGIIVLIDSELTIQHQNFNKDDFDLIYINSIKKYIIKGIRDLIQSINDINPEFEFPISTG